MKKFLSVLLASSMLLVSAYVISYANDIVLPDDEFEEEITFLRGDVDGNGSVDLDDFTALGKLVAGAAIVPEGEADVDRNGTVDLDDFTVLGKMIAGAQISWE